MGLFELAFLFSAAVALYNFQQIKIALKKKGYAVEMLTGWLRDYRQFKELIDKESDPKSKIDYQKNFNGLHFALIGMAVFAFMIIRKYA